MKFILVALLVVEFHMVQNAKFRMKVSLEGNLKSLNPMGIFFIFFTKINLMNNPFTEWVNPSDDREHQSEVFLFG